LHFASSSPLSEALGISSIFPAFLFLGVLG